MWWAIWILALVSFFIFPRFFPRKNIKKTPFDNLQSKFSNGEISLREYEQIKRQLYREEDLKMKMFFLSKI